jgi:translation initiation factor 4E
MKPPTELPLNTELHFFKRGIKPLWEVCFGCCRATDGFDSEQVQDASNRTGGKLTLAMRKGFSGRLWEELVRAPSALPAPGLTRVQLLAIMGEQFGVGDDICGAVVSVRHGGDLLSVWHRSAHDVGIREQIRCARKTDRERERE